MNANEIRVGNGLNYKLSNGETIYTVVTDTIIMRAVQFSSDFNNWFSPIPLSPEILEKCGFELNRNNELSIEINDIASHLELMSGTGGFYYPSFTQTPQGDEERTVYFNRINSLHQIQNLYFSLCGEELTYKQ